MSCGVLAVAAVLSTCASASNATVSTPSYSKIYFRFQSHGVPFDKWIIMFTLCLAPLVTHIAFGLPEPVILSSRQPGWLDKLTQFNPITIIWRWYAIAYRRIRAKSWDRADMAASNAIFWTNHGWDGSEAMMLRSRDWITKLPSKTHVDIVSGSSLATIAMTLQGIDAVHRVVIATRADWRDSTVSLPTLFYPVATLSLTRLPAAIWLSNEYGYGTPNDAGEEEAPLTATSSAVFVELPGPGQRSAHARGLSFRNETTHTIKEGGSRLIPVNTTRAHLWCFFWLFSVVGTGGLGIYILGFSGLGPGIIVTQLTGLAFKALFGVLLFSNLCIMVFYVLKGHAANTAIPCMNSRWYKVLNLLIITLALVAVIIAALETTISPDGTFTTYRIPDPAQTTAVLANPDGGYGSPKTPSASTFSAVPALAMKSEEVRAGVYIARYTTSLQHTTPESSP